MTATVSPEHAAELAAAVQEEYLDVVARGIGGHKRSLQRRIGPSEVGIPCTRALIHKINQDPEPPRAPAWKPAVGTAIHAQMDEWFSEESGTNGAHGRWLTEQRVVVGHIGGQEIAGHTDLWDEWSHAVIDHKFVGAKKLLGYKANGPGQQYRTQAHLYGRGWERAGKKVDLVMIAFMLRDGEIQDNYFWFEPYDRDVAEQALTKANALHAATQALGIEKLLQATPACDSIWCPWCSPIVPAQNRGIRRFKP